MRKYRVIKVADAAGRRMREPIGPVYLDRQAAQDARNTLAEANAAAVYIVRRYRVT